MVVVITYVEYVVSTNVCPVFREGTYLLKVYYVIIYLKHDHVI